MSLFNSIIEEKLENKKTARYNSVSFFVSYIEFLGFIGRIEEIYFSFKVVDRIFIENNINELNEIGVYNRLKSLVDKIDNKNEYNIKRFIINEENIEQQVFNSITKFYNELKSKVATHEENLVLNYLLNLAIDNKVLIDNLNIKLVNYFANAKNCNNYRKDYCIFSVVDFCIKIDDVKFFTMRKQFYNHIQKIYSRIYKSPLLSSNQRLIYQECFSSKLKEKNNLKSMTNRKVAVCFSGLYRNHFESIKSIKDNIIDPLNADVFIHTWDEKSVWNGTGGTPTVMRLFGSAVNDIVPNEIKNIENLYKYLPSTFNKIKDPVFERWNGNEIKEILNPKSILLENQKDFEESLTNKENFKRARGSLNQLKMFYSIKKSFDLALESDDYDCIIRIRPDLLIKNKLSISDIENLENNIIYTGVTDVGLQDVEFILTSSMAYNFSNFVNKMFSYNVLSPYEDFPLYCSHTLLLAWMLENNYKQDSSLINRSLLNMSNKKVRIEGLNAAIDEDLTELSDEKKSELSLFVRYLKDNHC